MLKKDNGAFFLQGITVGLSTPLPSLILAIPVMECSNSCARARVSTKARGGCGNKNSSQKEEGQRNSMKEEWGHAHGAGPQTAVTARRSVCPWDCLAVPYSECLGRVLRNRRSAEDSLPWWESVAWGRAELDTARGLWWLFSARNTARVPAAFLLLEWFYRRECHCWARHEEKRLKLFLLKSSRWFLLLDGIKS